MNKLLEKKTGVLRLSNGITFPCDATVNTDSTFNTELMATIGETMYLLLPRAYEKVIGKDGTEYLGRMIVDKTCITRVTICKIAYATGCGVVLHGLTEKGEKKSAVQELFY